MPHFCRFGAFKLLSRFWSLISLLEYRLISKKGEGTFSEVLKAQSTKTNKYVAIKCMKAHFYNIDQVTREKNWFQRSYIYF